jgi:hypothetical protein
VVLHSVQDIADFITSICDTDESQIPAEKNTAGIDVES